MTITYLGGLTVGGAVPGADLAVTAGIAGINAGLANLFDQLSALAAYTPTPIDFAAQIGVAQDIVSGLTAAISAGITPPSLGDQLALIAAQVATLTATIDGIEVNLDLLTGLQAPLATAGVHAYAFDGDTDSFGAELDGELAGGVPGGSPSDHANAVAIITTIPATWLALGEIVKVAL